MYEIINEKFIRNTTNSSGQRTALSLVHIVCDTASDMPEPFPHWISGSVCEVLENGRTTYKLSGSRKWLKVNASSGGSGGGGSSGTPANVDVDFDDEELNFTANQTSFSVDPADENLYFG